MTVLTIGGGAAQDSSLKSAIMIDAMQDTTGWTCYVGDGAAWAVNETRMGTDAHVAPLGTPWMYGFTGFDAYNGTNMGCRLDKTFSASDLSIINNIGFWAAFDSEWQANSAYARLATFNLYLGSDGDASLDNSVVATFTRDAENLYGITFIAFDRTDFSVNAGIFDWENFQDVRIEMLGAATSSPWCFFQGLQVNHYYKPTVVIGHDDGPAGFYANGKAVCDSFGYKTTQYLYPGPIDSLEPSVMTIAEVTELYNEGHDIALHATYSGDVLNTMSLAEINTDAALGVTWLETNGFNRAKHCASYPTGVFVAGAPDTGAFVHDVLADNGITCVRGSREWYNHDNWSMTDKYDTTKTNHCSQLSLQPVAANNPPSTVLRPALERVCKYGGVLILNFHNVLPTGSTSQAIDVADYEYALQMVKDYENLGKIQVKTISQVFGVNGELLIEGN